ncbi:hypothetical protein DSL72_000641 [Monilinia vaccinii-corymbosi]|uniref:4-hydroxy-3-methoxy-5-polyprenylbenzoate decarboxylase n=1 Tax=Monilinia vaccinii-corymbosi TaxID=61207 RepID=A0A8A3P3B7_9HELO|nr:hypothetical protein DSL72_000641 [Monilinia vaccinii-corymbosi]
MSLSPRLYTQAARLPRELLTACSITLATRSFSVLHRPAPNYPGHVPLTSIERGSLAVGSAVMAFFNPYRAGKHRHLSSVLTLTSYRKLDLIAACGEATATPYFIYRLRDAMLSSPTGRRILRDRPRISSKTLSMTHLRSLPPSAVGRCYADWLDREGVSPDTRDTVKYIDDEECAYVMQRYRECHDFYHAITGLPIVREGEVALKAFEFANTLLPMTGLSMVAVMSLKPAERRRFFTIYAPWAFTNGLKAEDVINVYWEEQLERSAEELREELGIEKPLDLRDIRRMEKGRKKAQKAT